VSAPALRVLGVRAEPYAVVPTLAFRIGIEGREGERIDSLALHAQIRLEPAQRRYEPGERARLLALFGTPERWGSTVRSLLWTRVTHAVPGFVSRCEIELPVVCTYDFEVVATRYLHALDQGEVPLLFLFSGTLFRRGDAGLEIEPLPWDRESAFRMPVAVWRELMDRYFPGETWIRMRRDSIDALNRFRSEQALTSWDEAIALLIERGARPAGARR
jgi:hypothetical protein